MYYFLCISGSRIVVYILSPIKINPRFITVLQSILNCTIVSKVLNLALEPDYKLGCSTVPGTKNDRKYGCARKVCCSHFIRIGFWYGCVRKSGTLGYFRVPHFINFSADTLSALVDLNLDQRRHTVCADRKYGCARKVCCSYFIRIGFWYGCV